MLTSLYKALLTQLEPLAMPVFLTDCVPQGSCFPYMTAQILAPLSAGDAGQIKLTIWCCADTPNAERLLRTDALLALLPSRGLRLTLPDGAALLRRTGTTLSVRDDIALGLQTTWQLQYYPHA